MFLFLCLLKQVAEKPLSSLYMLPADFFSTLWCMAPACANLFDCFLVFCPVDSNILFTLLPSALLFLLPAATFPITQLSAPLQLTTFPWVPLSSTRHAFHQRHCELLLHLFFSSGFSGQSLSLLTPAYSLWSFNTFPCYTTPCLVFRFWVQLLLPIVTEPSGHKLGNNLRENVWN